MFQLLHSSQYVVVFFLWGGGEKLKHESANLLFSVLENVYEFILLQFLALFIRPQLVLFSLKLSCLNYFATKTTGKIFIPHPEKNYDYLTDFKFGTVKRNFRKLALLFLEISRHNICLFTWE